MTVLVVETNLELRPSAAGYDSSALDDLFEAAMAMDSDLINRIDIVPAGVPRV